MACIKEECPQGTTPGTDPDGNNRPTCKPNKYPDGNHPDHCHSEALHICKEKVKNTYDPSTAATLYGPLTIMYSPKRGSVIVAPNCPLYCGPQLDDDIPDTCLEREKAHPATPGSENEVEYESNAEAAERLAQEFADKFPEVFEEEDDE